MAKKKQRGGGLEETKNERLLQLVWQTDSYLRQIAAQAEQQRNYINRAVEPDTLNAFVEELDEKGIVPLKETQMWQNMYYTVTHTVQGNTNQQSIMVHGTLKGYQGDLKVDGVTLQQQLEWRPCR